MAFIPEDGTGLPTANAYIDVAFFDEYFTDRANTAMTELSEEEKRAAIIKATDYVEMLYGKRYIGEKLTDEQALGWPRECTGMDEMPLTLKKAIAEYASRAHVGALAPDLTVDATGRLATKLVKKVGPIVKETSYASEGAQAAPMLYKPYPLADGYMSPLIRSSAGVYR